MSEPAKQRSGDQPLPAGGRDCVQDALIVEIERRKQLGIERYGSPLMAHNGRSGIRDAREEAVDLAVYLMQVELETRDQDDELDQLRTERDRLVAAARYILAESSNVGHVVGPLAASLVDLIREKLTDALERLSADSPDRVRSCPPDSPDNPATSTDTADNPGPCDRHPGAPAIGGICGGCTQYPADMQPAAAAGQSVTRLAPAPGAGTVPCCGRTPFELPRTDRLTEDLADVTCRRSVSTAAARPLPTDHLRMSTGTRVPTIDRLIMALANEAADRRLTPVEVNRLENAAIACGHIEAALAALHEGEEPYVDDNLTPTPGQWIWRWLRATPQERLEAAQHIFEAGRRADRCQRDDHEATIEALRRELDTMRHVAQRNGAANRIPYEAGEEARAAVDRARKEMESYLAAGVRMVNIRQVINLLSPTWPAGNYEAPEASPPNADAAEADR